MRAIVPVKRFDLAKQRLAGAITPTQRMNLARDMAENVLRELALSRALTGVFVVSGEPSLRPLAARLGFAWLDDPERGLNTALATALARLMREKCTDAAIVHADLPLFAAAEFDRIAARHAVGAARKMTIVPDRLNDGTTIRFCRPIDAVPPLYGAGSARAHCAFAAARGIVVERVQSPTLSVDCDTPADLAHIHALDGADGAPRFIPDAAREGLAP